MTMPSGSPPALLLLNGITQAMQSAVPYMFQRQKHSDAIFLQTLSLMLAEKYLKYVKCLLDAIETSYYWSLFYLAEFDMYIFRDTSEMPDM